MPTYRNKITGKTIYVPDSGPPQDPKFPFEGPQAAATLGKTREETTRTQVQTQGDILGNTKTERELRQTPISQQDQARIEIMRQAATGMPELAGKLQTAVGAIDRFKPSEARGSNYGLFYPEANDWPTTTLTKNVTRGMFTDPRGRKDYNVLRSMQESAVLKTQEAQKGPQTEADAARMKASTISPTKDVSTNALLAAEALFNAKLAELKPDFYSKWANRFGSLATLDKNGDSVDRAWSRTYERAFSKLRNDDRYKRLTGASPRRNDDGWKVERIGD